MPPSGRCDTTSGMMDPKCYLKGFAELKRKQRTTTPTPVRPSTTIKPTPKPTTRATTTTTRPPATKPTTTTTTTTSTTPTTRRPTQTTTTRPTQPTTLSPLVDERVRRLADKYCKNRDAGLYQLPVICDVFVSCSLGNKAEPLVCPEGTNFNPEFQTCDHSNNFECFYENATRK